MTYRCEFVFRGKQLCARAGRLDIFTGGFWIDECLELADPGEERYWIPAHQVSYIAKDRGKVVSLDR